MIQRVYEQAKQSTLLTRVIVATDHPAIVKAVEEFGGEVMMTSPELPSGSDRVAAVAREVSGASIIVNIQGDEPLIAPQMIDQAIQPLIDDTGVQVGTLVKKITRAEELLSPNVVKVVVDSTGTALYFSRFPIPYVRETKDMNHWHNLHPYYKHIGLYVFRRKLLLEFTSWNEGKLEKAERLEQLRILEHGYRITATLTDYDSIPIDTEQDAERVRTLLQQQER